MGFSERRNNLAAQGDGLVECQRPARQAGGERLALDQLHRDVQIPVDLANLVDRADVRVIQRGGGPSLAHQSSRGLLVAVGGLRQHLDRDVAIQSEIARTIDFAHPSGAQPANELIVAELPADPGADHE